ncbi:MAG: hypothetical protein JWO22_339 [Frankiales bacterium]|nr:hypothetical protein [Frankiales bacterium]
MTVLLIVLGWTVAGSVATLVTCALGRAGRMEDEARGWGDLPPIQLPRPRQARDPLISAVAEPAETPRVEISALG